MSEPGIRSGVASRQHETTIVVDGVSFEVEWEMDGNIPVWSLPEDDVCGGPNLTDKQRDAINEALDEYMNDYYREDF